MSKTEINKIEVDKNLPEDERGMKFRRSKLVEAAAKKRKIARPKSGIDRIRLIDLRVGAVDVHARFNYEEASFERDFTLVIPKTGKADKHIMVELRRLYRKMKPETGRVSVPDSLKVRKVG